MNKYYVPGEQRSAHVRNLFGKIAHRYDLINDFQSLGLHRRWKLRLINLAQVRLGERTLDICCGTGDLVGGLKRRGAEAIGLDFSEPMLAQAQEMACPLVQGDAQRLPFASATFDIVTIGYGLRNLASWEIGLQEMWRVAKRGGRLLVLDFGKPDSAIWRAIYFAYLRLAVPQLGRLFHGDAQTYAYILESLREYPAQCGVEAKLKALGGQDVKTIPLMGGAMAINCAVKA